MMDADGDGLIQTERELKVSIKTEAGICCDFFRSDLNLMFGETEGHTKRGFSGPSARNEA